MSAELFGRIFETLDDQVSDMIMSKYEKKGTEWGFLFCCGSKRPTKMFKAVLDTFLEKFVDKYEFKSHKLQIQKDEHKEFSLFITIEMY